MRRADRLFDIIQVLRRATGPLTAERIAAELETGKRTVYRDIGALIARRVPIRGEAGVGYVLERGFDLPPLMLTADEVEATALGAQWVVAHADAALARAALGVLAKIAAVVPENLRPVVDDPTVGSPPARSREDGRVDISLLRRWCREGRKLSIGYADATGVASERVIRPFMVGYVTGIRVIAAWCELRQDFRIFRTDRMTAITFHDQRYPDRPATLRRRWLATTREQRAASPATDRDAGSSTKPKS